LGSVAVRVFQCYASKEAVRATDRDLFAFVAEPSKPQAQDKLTFSAMARVDDKSNRSQFCVRLRLRFNLSPVINVFKLFLSVD